MIYIDITDDVQCYTDQRLLNVAVNNTTLIKEIVSLCNWDLFDKYVSFSFHYYQQNATNRLDNILPFLNTININMFGTTTSILWTLTTKNLISENRNYTMWQNKYN